MQYPLFITLLLISSIGYSQVQQIKKEVKHIKSESFVIGIGNSQPEFYNNVLESLENTNGIEIFAICESHHIIGYNILNNTYEGYDTIRDLLQNEFESLILYRKDDSIFSNDCRAEIKKQ